MRTALLPLMLALAPFLAGGGPAPTADRPEALVARLGAGRYAEREAAARALEGLGRDALPALRAARAARDPEVKARAAALVERLEAQLMVRPTLVRLDLKDRPLADAVAEVARQAGIGLELDPAARAGLGRRRVSVEADGPVPFWEAVGRLSRAGGLRDGVSPRETADGKAPRLGLVLGPAPRGRRAPTAVSGPFRIKLTGAHYERRRQFEDAPDAPGPGGDGAFEQFTVQMEILAEPRLTVAQQGNLRLEEAIDDKGQSLVPTGPAEADGPDDGSVEVVEFNAGPALQLPIVLKYPKAPGRVIRRLRGALPVMVAARKDEPLDIPLAGAAGKTFVGGDVTLVVHSIRTDPAEGQTTLELTARPRTTSDPGPARAAERPVGLGTEFLGHQLEVVDARGRPFLAFPQETSPQGGGVKLTLLLAPGEGATAPARLRFYGLTRAATEVRFDFSDVPMP